ncbi:sigma factor-like helix-turn-helix DNA-binding protein [Garciella nitratireducens]|uniref:sigma factor-like helix-turn-helix DNA-binding protein n=1 Tax=Garciella nitratireducens TaxID=218205 RepID=UPI001BD36860|nr:sigma factor-like helix-turn-helix DNA-binding protein [Garciella nitratireducens]
MMKKPFVDDAKVEALLYKYKLGQKDKNQLNKQHQNEILIELYYLMEPLLKWSITGDITKVYSKKIRNQKFSTLIEIQKSLSINNYKCYAFDITSAFEKYLNDYIQLYGYGDGSHPYEYSLIYPFWEMLNGTSLDKIEKSVMKYNNQYSYYLTIRFCDQYWSYIYKCVRRDLTMRVLSIDMIRHKCNSDDSTNYFDKFQYKYNMFTLINKDELDNISSIIEEKLTDREHQVLKLFTEGYSHKEIADILHITSANSRQIKKRASNKIKGYLQQNEY